MNIVRLETSGIQLAEYLGIMIGLLHVNVVQFG